MDALLIETNRPYRSCQWLAGFSLVNKEIIRYEGAPIDKETAVSLTFRSESSNKLVIEIGKALRNRKPLSLTLDGEELLSIDFILKKATAGSNRYDLPEDPVGELIRQTLQNPVTTSVPGLMSFNHAASILECIETILGSDVS